jgi:hypothetical protein
MYSAHQVGGDAHLASVGSSGGMKYGVAAATAQRNVNILQDVEAIVGSELRLLITDINTANKSVSRFSGFLTCSLAEAAGRAQAEAQKQQAANSAEEWKTRLRFNIEKLAAQVSLLASELKTLEKAFKVDAIEFSALVTKEDVAQKQAFHWNSEATSLAAELKALREANERQVLTWESEAKSNRTLRELIEKDSTRQQEEVDALVCQNLEMRERLGGMMFLKTSADKPAPTKQSKLCNLVSEEGAEKCTRRAQVDTCCG